MNTGFEAMRTAEQIANVANTLKDAADVAQGVANGASISVTYGEQKSVETQYHFHTSRVWLSKA